MNVIMRDIESIRPYPDNPRKTGEAIDPVARSIREFGFRQPIVVDGEGIIVVGHVRFQAAQKLGLAQVPVHVAADLTPAQARAYRIADNKTNEFSEWDLDKLAAELTGLEDMEFDLDALGFQTDELMELLGDDESDEPEDLERVPDPPDEAVSIPGEIYQVGGHRLMCGDSASASDLDALLGGAAVHLVNTDPPYNVKIEPRSNNAIAVAHSSSTHGNHQRFDLSRHPEKIRNAGDKLRPKDRPLKNDFLPADEFDLVLRAWFGNIGRVLEPGRAFYIWGGYVNCANYPAPLREAGLYFSQAVIWVKGHPVMTRKDFMGNHEWCFYGWREGRAHEYFGPHNATDVWEVKKVPHQRMVHLTEKPVELAELAIGYSSRPSENVLDLFGGSGSTLMAAEATGRTAYLMELDPLYCDVIRRRWAEYVHGEGCDWQGMTPVIRRVDLPSAPEISVLSVPELPEKRYSPHGFWSRLKSMFRINKKA